MRSILTILAVVMVAYVTYYIVQHSGSKSYINPTIGISFEYPYAGTITIKTGDDDPITHGDVLRDGRIYRPFLATLNIPGFKPIVIAHSPLESQSGLSYDYMSRQEQLKIVSCIGTANNCEQKENPNSVDYVESSGCDTASGTCIEQIKVPTGKYIMNFSVIGNSTADILPSVSVIRKIVSTIKLR